MKSLTFLKISLAILLNLFLLNQVAAETRNTRPNEPGPWPSIQVNTFSGNLFYQRTDLVIPTRGEIPLEIKFSYNSLKHNVDEGYGNGWSFSLGLHYTYAEGSFTVFREEGEEDIFTWDGAMFVPPTGVYDALTEYESGKYLLRTKYGIRYYFENNSHKHLTKIVDRNGNTTTLSYTGGQLTTITEPSGRMLSLGWVGDHLSQLTDPNTSPNRVIAFTYDGSWNMTQVTRPLTNIYQYGYDAFGNMTSATDPRSSTVSISYDVNDAVGGLQCAPVSYNKTFTYNNCDNTTTVHQTVSALPRQTTYTYDLTGRITKIKHADGFSVFYAWDGQNNLITFTNEMGSVTSYLYDARGNLLSETDCLNNTETYSYETTYNNILSFINKNGIPTNFSYDANGNLATVTDYLLNTESYTYDSYGEMITYTDKRGFLTTYSYNSYGDLTVLTDHLGKYETYTYDLVGNMLTYKDKRLFTTTYTYDQLDRLTSTLYPLGYTFTYTYDANGNIASETNQNFKTTNYSYDPLNRLIGKTDALSGTTSYILDEAGNIISETDARDSITYYSFDKLNRQISTTDCKGKSELFSYDGTGNIITATDKNLNTTSYFYDCLGRLTLTTYPDTYTDSYSYDNLGNKLSYTNKNGIPTSYTYDGLNRLTSTLYSYGYSESYSYDEESNTVSFTDKRGFVTTYSYDALGRLATTTDPMAGVEAYIYDEEGNKISYTDKNGYTTTYTYDQSGRLTMMTDPFTNYESYTYDGAGNQLTVTDKRGNITTYTFDGLDRLIGILDPMAYTESFTYDEMGNQLTSKDKNNNTTTYAYDGLNRLISTTDPLGFIENYSYDPVGHRISLTEKNLGVTSWNYSCCNLMSTTDPLFQTESYGYDQEGNMITLTNKNGQITSYQYDNLDRLKKITTPLLHQTQYTFDGNGNPVSMIDANSSLINYTYNPRNEMISIQYPDMTFVNYTYDNNGNVTQALHSGGIGDNTTYTYDALDRLTLKVTNYGLFSKNVSYLYDPKGNCTGMTTETGTIYYQYDANDRTTQITDQGGLITTFTYDGVGNQTAVHYPNGVSTYTTYDAMGNVLSVITRDVISNSNPDPAPVKKVVERTNNMLFLIDYGVTEIITPVSGPGLTDHELVTIHVMNYGIETLPSIMVSYSIDGGIPVEETIPFPIPPMVPFPYTFFQTGDFSEPGHTYELTARTIVPGDQNPGNDFTMSLVTNGGGGGGAIYQSFVYEYDVMGNKTREDHLDGSFVTFTYSLRNELLSEYMMPSSEFLSYTYTNTGLRDSKIDNGIISLYNYNNDDILISAGTTVYIPDNKGNRVEKIDVSGSTIYTYGFENELSTVIFPSGDISHYKYSPFGRLLQKTENGLVINMLTEGKELLEEIDYSGSFNYFYNPDLSIHYGTSTGYYYEDGAESATLLMDPLKAILATADFDEYGNSNFMSGTWMNNRTVFNNMTYSTATGLYQIDDSDFPGPTRYFDPITGQPLMTTDESAEDEGAGKGKAEEGKSNGVGASAASGGKEAKKGDENKGPFAGASVGIGGKIPGNAKPAEPAKSDEKKKQEEEKKKKEEEKKKKEPTCPIGKTYKANVSETKEPILRVDRGKEKVVKGDPEREAADNNVKEAHIKKAEQACIKGGVKSCVGACKNCNQKCKGEYVFVPTDTKGSPTSYNGKKIAGRVIPANQATCKCDCK